MNALRWLLVASISLAPFQAYGRAGISGAASMRVEVEVYKGPIGQSLEIQIGELSAVLGETVKAMNDWSGAVLPLRHKLPNDPDGPIFDQALASAAEVASSICRIDDYRLEAWSYRPFTSGNDERKIQQRTLPGDACFAYRENRAKLESVAEVGTSKRAARERYKPDATKPPVQAGTKDGRKAELPKLDPSFPNDVRWLSDSAIGAEPTAQQIIAANKEQGLTYQEYNRRVAVVAAQMRLAAFRLVDTNVGQVPKEPAVRRAIAGLNLILMEMANTIATRNSNLQKLLDRCSEKYTPDSKEPCNEASKLPTSDYLRDTEPTRFIEAFDWFNAALDSRKTGALKLKDRVRAIKALTDDYYWEKVNEVYASGQGDVSMAFIKDDLGNWNLKSYSNDASKLLAAYRGVVNAALASAVKLASKAATGAPGALVQGNRLLDFANRIATGQGNGAASGGNSLTVEGLRQRTTERLTKAKEKLAARQVTLMGEGGTVDSPAKDSDLEKLVTADNEATKLASQRLDAQLKEAQKDDKSEAYRAAQEAYRQAAAAQQVAHDKLIIARYDALRLPEQAATLAQSIIADYQSDLTVLKNQASQQTPAAQAKQ